MLVLRNLKPAVRCGESEIAIETWPHIKRTSIEKGIADWPQYEASVKVSSPRNKKTCRNIFSTFRRN